MAETIHIPRAQHLAHLKKMNPDPDNYIKAVVEHRESGKEYSVYTFIQQFDSRVNGAGELARRALEAIVVPWIKERERPFEAPHGYRPKVAWSIFKPVENVNLPIIGMSQ